MKYFDEIYQAAKNRDDKTLVALFKKGACIDTRNKSEWLISPAGLLAQEGDFESAKYLYEYYGANPIFIALGCKIANRPDGAPDWVTQLQLDAEVNFLSSNPTIRQILYQIGYETKTNPDTATMHNTANQAQAVTGEFDLNVFGTIKILHRTSYLNALAHAGHIYLLEAIFTDSMINTMPSLYSLFAKKTYTPDTGVPVYRLQTEKLALHTFSFIKSDKFLAAILKMLVQEKGVIDGIDYDLEAVMNKSRKIRTIMASDQVGYSQALAVCDQRIIDLPPLLQTKLPFFKQTTHVDTTSNQTTITTSTSIGFGVE